MRTFLVELHTPSRGKLPTTVYAEEYATLRRALRVARRTRLSSVHVAVLVRTPAGEVRYARHASLKETQS